MRYFRRNRRVVMEWRWFSGVKGVVFQPLTLFTNHGMWFLFSLLRFVQNAILAFLLILLLLFSPVFILAMVAFDKLEGPAALRWFRLELGEGGGGFHLMM